MFVDCDVMARADLAELFALYDPLKACMVVKHDYTPKTDTKMKGQAQLAYFRKNWSSRRAVELRSPKGQSPDARGRQSRAKVYGCINSRGCTMTISAILIRAGIILLAIIALTLTQSWCTSPTGVQTWQAMKTVSLQTNGARSGRGLARMKLLVVGPDIQDLRKVKNFTGVQAFYLAARAASARRRVAFSSTARRRTR